MVEVTQIEDDDHYELSDNNGRYTMDIYNVTSGHQGAYLCIAVNDNGQSHHSFKLRIKGKFAFSVILLAYYLMK